MFTLLGSIRNRVTRNTGMDKNREMKKKSYIQTVETSWLISLGISLKYVTLYAIFVKGALPLPLCIIFYTLKNTAILKSLTDLLFFVTKWLQFIRYTESQTLLRIWIQGTVKTISKDFITIFISLFKDKRILP